MRRRDVIGLLGGVAVERAGAAAGGDAGGRFHERAVADDSAHLVHAFQQGLADDGFLDGQNGRVDFRWARGEYDRLPEIAADLVRRQVNAALNESRTSAFLAPGQQADIYFVA